MRNPPLRRINSSLTTLSELLVFGLLLANILQSSIAIRSPPAPYPPVSSPAKAISPPRQQSTSANWRILGNNNKSAGLSPKVRLLPHFLPSFHHSSSTQHEQTTPQRQLPFSASVGGPTGSASDPRGLAQSYSLAYTNFLTSPTSPSPSSPSAPLDRSFGSLPPSPSPTSPLAAYRGRRAPTGRASFFLFSGLLVLFFFWNSDADAWLDGMQEDWTGRCWRGLRKGIRTRTLRNDLSALFVLSI